MILNENFVWYAPPKDADPANVHKKALDRAKTLYEVSEEFRTQAFRYFLLVDFKGYNAENEGIEQDKHDEDLLLQNPYLTFNITASCIETISNKIAKTRPKVTFLTKNADRAEKEIARKMDHWVFKIFKKSKIWKDNSQAFKSACVCGLGCVKINIKDSRVHINKVPIFDMFFDNAYKGNLYPKEAGEYKSMILHDIIELFPDKKDELIQKHGDKLDASVMVYEIYREYKKHMIFTKDVVLSNEKWDKPLPYVLHKFEQADQGVISVGVGKKLYSIQAVISYILGKTLTGIKNFAVPRVFLPKGSQPTESSLTNLVGQIIEVNSEDGRVPQFSTPPATNAQVLDILNLLWIRGFEIIGVSQLSAGGAIPRGMENASGTALRNYQQVESERFEMIRSDYDDTYITIAKRIIKLVPDSMLPKGVSRSVLMDAKDDISIWTSSLLPETPAGKLAMAGDLFNIGLLKGNQALDLLNSPDTKKYLNSETARIRAIDLLLDKSIESGKKPPYYPELGLDTYLDRARKIFAEVIIEEGQDSKKIALLSECIEELEAKVSQQTQIGDSIIQMGGQPPNTQRPEPPQFGARENTY